MSSQAGQVIVKIPKLNIPTKYVEPILIDVDKLVSHEEIVEGRLRALADKISREGVVDMPIVVAPIPGTDKYLIVDGHHRWAALKAMGYRKIPCIVIDYFDGKVGLKTWLPAIKGPIEPFLENAMKHGLPVEACSGGRPLDELLGSNAFVILGRDGRSWCVRGSIEEQKAVSKILGDLNMEGAFVLYYYGELDDAMAGLRGGEVDYLFLRKAVTKQEVMEMARRGQVYAPKTTRHILPFIPAFTNTPLELLK
ncbi:MAG: DUF5603 domain-containing protein [Desulfurococcaceae archaeon]